MKKLVLPVVLAIAALATMPARAATDTKTFDVTVNLTAVCSISTAPGTIALTYVDGGAATSNTTDFGVKCTTGLPYSFSVDAPVALAGLTYSLDFRNSGDTASVTGGTGAGTATETSYKIKASMAAGQAGNCTAATQVAGGCNQTKNHTLTLTY